MTRSLHFHKRYQLLLGSLPTFPLLPISYIRMLFFYLYQELPPPPLINQESSIYHEIKAFFNIKNYRDKNLGNSNSPFCHLGSVHQKITINKKNNYDHKIFTDGRNQRKSGLMMSQKGNEVKKKSNVSFYDDHETNKYLNNEETKNETKSNDEVMMKFKGINKNQENKLENNEINTHLQKYLSFESNQSNQNPINISKNKINPKNNLSEFIENINENSALNKSSEKNLLAQKNQSPIEIDNPKKDNEEYQEILNEIEVVNQKRREKILEIKQIERKIKGIKHQEKLNKKSKKIIKNKSHLDFLLYKLQNQKLKDKRFEKAYKNRKFYPKNENSSLSPHRFELLKTLTPRNWLFVLNHLKKFGFKGYFRFFEGRFCGISYFTDRKRVENGRKQIKRCERKQEGEEEIGERGRKKDEERGEGGKIYAPGEGVTELEEEREASAALTRTYLENECQNFPSHFIWNEGEGKNEVGDRFWKMNRFLKEKTKLFWRAIAKTEGQQQKYIKKRKINKKNEKKKIPLQLSYGSSFLILRLAQYQSENSITEEKMALDLIQTSMNINDLAKLYLEGREEVRWTEDDDRTLLNCKEGNDLGFKILTKFKGRKRILRRTRFKGIKLPFKF